MGDYYRAVSRFINEAFRQGVHPDQTDFCYIGPHRIHKSIVHREGDLMDLFHLGPSFAVLESEVFGEKPRKVAVDLYWILREGISDYDVICDPEYIQRLLDVWESFTEDAEYRRKVFHGEIRE